jgi:hypothetical protein
MKTKIIHVLHYSSHGRADVWRGVDADSPDPTETVRKAREDEYLSPGDQVECVASYRRPVDYYEWAGIGFAELSLDEGEAVDQAIRLEQNKAKSITWS